MFSQFFVYMCLNVFPILCIYVFNWLFQEDVGIETDEDCGVKPPDK